MQRSAGFQERHPAKEQSATAPSTLDLKSRRRGGPNLLHAGVLGRNARSCGSRTSSPELVPMFVPGRSKTPSALRPSVSLALGCERVSELKSARSPALSRCRVPARSSRPARPGGRVRGEEPLRPVEFLAALFACASESGTPRTLRTQVHAAVVPVLPIRRRGAPGRHAFGQPRSPTCADGLLPCDAPPATRNPQHRRPPPHRTATRSVSSVAPPCAGRLSGRDEMTCTPHGDYL